MIAVDTNILVYAHREDAEHHAAASSALERLATGREQFAVPWPCAHEFLAIVTHPRVYRPPTLIPNALAQIEAWLRSPSLVLLGETSKHWQHLRTLLVEARIEGPKVHDARIAAQGRIERRTHGPNHGDGADAKGEA